MPERRADQQDERVHRKQVAREQSAAQDGEGDRIGRDDHRNGGKGLAGKAGFAGDRLDRKNSQRAGDRDPHIHVEEEVDEAVPETEEDARRREICGGVVAEELGVPEGEAGDVVMVGIPEDQGEDGEGERYG